MKSLWITLLLIALFAASANFHSLAQTPEKLYHKGDERIEKKGDVETYQPLETNFPKRKNEVVFDREKLNRLTWMQRLRDRIGASLSGIHTPNNAYLEKEYTTSEPLINGEKLIITVGADTFWRRVLQFLKTAGKSPITGGILSIFSVFILLMMIIHLYVSYTKISEWKLIL